MKVEGDAAAKYKPVRLDSLADLLPSNSTLVSADEDTGEVTWKDSTGTERSMRLGPHAFKLIRKWPSPSR